MSRITRRSFVHAAAAAPLALHSRAAAVHSARRPSDEILVGVVGIRSRGANHIDGFREIPGVRVAFLCDVDSEVLAQRAAQFAERGESVELFTDIRDLLARPELDVVSIATPNHLHALQTILACQAGKDVYVEKPVSHNIWEGGQAVRAARKYRRIVQAGMQSRSSRGIADGIRWVQEGNLGKITHAWGTCFKPRQSIGKVATPQEVPGTIDWPLYMGPRGPQPLVRKQLHYDWHWQFATGNGDLGNQGIHQVDQCRWGLGRETLAPIAISVGGRFGYEDDGDTPNTQFVYYDYRPAPLLFEVRGLPRDAASRAEGWGKSMDQRAGSAIGATIHCEGGRLHIPNYDSAVAYDAADKEVGRWKEAVSHFGNFIEAVRARDERVLSAPLREGHVSSALCHMGNDSYALGAPASRDALRAELESTPLAREALERFCAHLDANEIDPGRSPARLGRWLVLDQETEAYCGSPEAEARRVGTYVDEFRVPDEV